MEEITVKMLTVQNVQLRALEKEDLRYVHRWSNNIGIMMYWFEEPYESYVELEQIFLKHINDHSERRFIIEVLDPHEIVGMVELLEIDYIHRIAEFDILIDIDHQGQGYAQAATFLGLKYAFDILNLHKMYLIVERSNEKARHIYEKFGFEVEGELKEEIFVNGEYRNVYRMCLFQRDFMHSKDALREQVMTRLGQ